jgi:hypothetical protein
MNSKEPLVQGTSLFDRFENHMVTYTRPLPIGSFFAKREDHATLVLTLALLIFFPPSNVIESNLAVWNKKCFRSF